jgi:hypothetical protein
MVEAFRQGNLVIEPFERTVVKIATVGWHVYLCDDFLVAPPCTCECDSISSATELASNLV